MNQRTRNFLIGSAAVVILGLGTGIVAYYNGGLSNLTRASEEELNYLPQNSVAVAFADVRSIMSSEVRQKLRQIIPTGEEKEKLQAEFGVDLENDIDTVSAAYLGQSTSPFEGGVVVVRGRFNTGAIEARAIEHGAVVQEYAGKRMLVFSTSADQTTTETKHASGGVAFLETGVIALGEAEALKKAIDAAATGDNVKKNTELMNVINDVRGSGNAWFVAKVDAVTSSVGLPDELRSHIPAVSMLAVTAHVNGGVSGAIRADARDDQAAQQLRDVVRGALAAGQLVSGENPKIDAMLKSLQITGSGRTVGITFTVPLEMLDLLNGVAAAKQLASPSTISR
jgi:hypothetical protein